MTTKIDAASLLVRKGRELFDKPRELVSFTGDAKSDALLNDLDNYPHAFVLACIMDRQIPAERAWAIPEKINRALGTFEFARLKRLTELQVLRLMSKPEKLHRFPATMGRNFYSAVQRIATEYEGDASRIWRDNPSSATVVYRFLQFDGAGPKIATMAANILARQFKVPFSDYYSIDVSVDVQVKRVLERLGLSRKGETDPAKFVYLARAISPSFPGLIDFACWEAGRNWCRPTRPKCLECYLHDACPSVPGLSGRPT